MATYTINAYIKIEEGELSYSFARSSGPGGQHVNKTNTKVTLSWNLLNSRCLSQTKKDSIANKLSSLITVDGRITISSDRFRSQDRNKDDCLEKFIKLVQKAALVPKKRKKTRPSKASKMKRLDNKKNRGKTKELRKKVF